MNTRIITSLILLLGLGLFATADAQDSPSPSDNMKSFSVTDQTNFKENRFRGQIVRIDGSDYFIKTKDGTEVQLHRGETTKVTGAIKQGDMIEAKVDDNKHMLSIKPFSKDDMEKTNAGKQKQK
jgi:hypothetical protein